MGLDITAYRKITPAPDAPTQDGEPVDWENHFWAHPNSIKFTEENWPGHSEGIAPGVYKFADALKFRAGSYGGYNEWRSWLARVAGWSGAEECWRADETEARKRPFFELIHFADNDGVIGSKVAAKLAKDFADNEDKARGQAAGEHGGWYFQQYQKWREAFEMAADGGAVDFH